MDARNNMGSLFSLKLIFSNREVLVLPVSSFRNFIYENESEVSKNLYPIKKTYNFNGQIKDTVIFDSTMIMPSLDGIFINPFSKDDFKK
jgi:hypothetical protein